jgi:DNA-binding LacI/PurR family transcriptional regulator
MREMGRQAMEMMFASMSDNSKSANKCEQRLLPVKLTSRDSVGHVS